MLCVLCVLGVLCVCVLCLFVCAGCVCVVCVGCVVCWVLCDGCCHEMIDSFIDSALEPKTQSHESDEIR